MPEKKSDWISFYKDEQVLSLLAVVATITLLIYLFGSYLMPFIIGLVFAFVLNDLVVWLTKFNIRKGICVSVAVILLIGTILLVLLGLIPIVWKEMILFVEDLPRMITATINWLESLEQDNPEYFQQLQIFDINELLRSQVGVTGKNLIGTIISKVPDLFVIVVYIVLVPLIVFFLLLDWNTVTKSTLRNELVRGKLLGIVLYRMDQQLTAYVRGKFYEIIIMGIASFILFFLFDLRYSLLLALLVGVSVIIPYVGALLVTIPVALIALFQFGLSSEFYYLLIFYLVMQVLDGNVLVPLLFSETTDMHPVLIILSILLFGGMWGVLGVFFAIPLASLIKTIAMALISKYTKPVTN